MTLPIEAMGYHAGIVVESVDACTARFQGLLGGTFATWEVTKSAPGLVAPDLEESRLRVSYGRYAGMALEFIEVLEGRGLHAKYLEEHGEGVQHLGYWVPDLVTATREALEHGATVTSASVDEGELGAVTLAGILPAQVAAALVPGLPVYVDSGVASLELELLGPATLANLRRVFGDDLADVVALPPWA